MKVTRFKYTAGADPYNKEDKSKAGFFYVNKEGRISDWSVVYQKPEYYDARSAVSRFRFACWFWWQKVVGWFKNI